MADTGTVGLKQQIWHVTGGNLYWIVIAKARIRFDGDYEKLLKEVERMKQQAYEHHHPGSAAKDMG